MNFRLLLALFLVPLLTACATTYPQAPYAPIALAAYEATESSPAGDVEATAEVGMPMLKTFNIVKLPGLELKSAFQATLPYRNSKDMRVQLAPGKLELAATDGSGGNYYRAAPGVLLTWVATDGGTSSQSTAVGGVHVTAQGTTSVWWLWGREGPANLLAATKLALQTTTVVRPADRGGQQDLVYSGVSGTTVSLLYREFLKDPTRPVAVQDLKYDIGRSKAIGFKGARIELIEAGNTSVRYRVMTPLQ